MNLKICIAAVLLSGCGEDGFDKDHSKWKREKTAPRDRTITFADTLEKAPKCNRERLDDRIIVGMACVLYRCAESGQWEAVDIGVYPRRVRQ